MFVSILFSLIFSFLNFTVAKVGHHRTVLSSPIITLNFQRGTRLRHCLHRRSFICNRIGFDAVTPFVYMAPVRVRYHNRVLLKTLSKVERFQNDTVSLVV